MPTRIGKYTVQSYNGTFEVLDGDGDRVAAGLTSFVEAYAVARRMSEEEA